MGVFIGMPCGAEDYEFRNRPRSALLIVGHGSAESPDSSNPTFEQARLIRERGLFAEVHCAFWKEEPGLRMVGYSIESDEVYIVPNFVSEGYFTREVIPREMELSGPSTRVHGKLWHYCDPVGVHPALTQLLLKRARETAPRVDEAHSALLVVGHGSSMNARSSAAVRSQIVRLRDIGALYQEIRDAYLEEEPLLANWNKLCTSLCVIVVPFFISNGLHGERDIPALLGLEGQRKPFFEGPYRIKGRTLYCGRAVGSEPAISDVILDQVEDFDRRRKNSGCL